MDVESTAMPGASGAVLPPADDHVQPALGAVACRCCPGGFSRSTRPRRYPSDSPPHQEPGASVPCRVRVCSRIAVLPSAPLPLRYL
jgi:hypothetical protein